MVSKRSDKRPTGNVPPATLYLAYLAYTPRSTGQRPGPMVVTFQRTTEAGYISFSAQRMHQVNLKYPDVGRDTAKSGMGHG
jgi:hypothetical protein